jgi:hypothetical protein
MMNRRVLPKRESPVCTDRTTVYRDREQVAAFKQQLEEVRQWGWKVPEALYAWLKGVISISMGDLVKFPI